MTLSQFNCPHCSNPFQVDASLASLQVACPHCQQPVALTSEPPVIGSPVMGPPVMHPPPAPPPVSELPANDPGGYSPTDLLPPEPVVSPEEATPKQAEENEPVANDYQSRQITADERASRKFVKNMIVWVCCAIVLVSILAFFLMQGGL